jgi:hypothetical protein
MQQLTTRVFATSNPMQISYVLDAILQLNPQSVLDVGCGSGKYGVLTREYLCKARIDGIEGFPQYVTDVHHLTYDNIYIGNALKVVSRIDFIYDLVVMIDMFEHLTPEEGASLLNDLSECSRSILISVPVCQPEQGALDGNVLQVHQAQYDVTSLRKLGFHQIWRISGSYIGLRGGGQVKLKLKVLKSAVACLPPFWVSALLAPIARKFIAPQKLG